MMDYFFTQFVNFQHYIINAHEKNLTSTALSFSIITQQRNVKTQWPINKKTGLLKMKITLFYKII